MMMNSICKTACALTVLAVSSTTVMASETVDITMTGTITPVACTPTLSEGGVMDYGSINPVDLSIDEYTVLGVKQLDFSIACNAAARIAIKVLSNRMNTAAGATEGSGGFAPSPVDLFGGRPGVAGLGLDGESKIGGYTARFVAGDTRVDAVVVDNISAATSGGSWRFEDVGSMAVNSRILSWAAVGTTAPVPVTNLAGKIEAQAYINKTSELDMTKTVTLDGSATIEIVYL